MNCHKELSAEILATFVTWPELSERFYGMSTVRCITSLRCLLNLQYKLCDCASKDKPRISSSSAVIVLPALVHWLFAGPWWSWRHSSSLRSNKMNQGYVTNSWFCRHESSSDLIVAPTYFISKSHSALVLAKDIYYIFYVSKLHRIKCICLQSSGNGSLVQCDLACDRKPCWVSSPFLLPWSFQPRSVVCRCLQSFCVQQYPKGYIYTYIIDIYQIRQRLQLHMSIYVYRNILQDINNNTFQSYVAHYLTKPRSRNNLCFCNRNVMSQRLVLPFLDIVTWHNDVYRDEPVYNFKGFLTWKWPTNSSQ